LIGLEVDRDTALVAVEQQEKEAVDRRVVHVPKPARTVAVRRALDLDHVGAEPGQHLRAARPRLVVGEIDDANAFQRLTHAFLPLAGGLRPSADNVCARRAAQSRRYFDPWGGSRVRLPPPHRGAAYRTGENAAGSSSLFSWRIGRTPLCGGQLRP